MMAEPTGGMVAGIASLDAVLRIAKHLPVFPCRRRDEEGFSNGRPVRFKAKSPLVDNGFFAATNDEAQIREWWKRWPEALVGVPTGQRTKLVAIDWDPDKHSDVTGEWIQANSDALMCARVHGTMRGGKHYVYRVGTGQIYRTGTDIELGGIKRTGLDLRADGGYIIWWPIHGGSASDNQAPFLPAGLIDERIEKPAAPRQLKPHSPVKWRTDKQQVVDALAYLDPAGRDLWRDVGMAIHLASVGSDDGFNVWHAWSSGGISGEMPSPYRGVDDCRYTWDTFKDTTANPVTLGSIFHIAKQHGWKKVEETPPDPEQPAAFADVTELGALMQATTEPREWFFEEILPAGAFLIVGRPKVGKSWLLLQLAISAASCGDFLGFPALGRFGVLYISSEDDVARIQSRFNRFNVTPPAGLRVMVRDDLLKRAAEFAQKMTFAQWLDEYLTRYPDVKFVFIDTESTCRHIWDGENGGSRERSITRKDYAEVREFDSIALKHRAFIGLVNHTAKRRNGMWFDIHELINRTNTALAGASGSIVMADPPGHDPMDTESRVRVLGIRGRDISGDHLLAIEQTKFGSFDSRGNWSNYAQTDAEAQICAALVEINEQAPEQWMTAKEVGAWISKSAGTVQRTISRMVSAGRTNYANYRIETKKGKGVKLFRTGGE
jgi:hypothetical protein